MAHLLPSLGRGHNYTQKTNYIMLPKGLAIGYMTHYIRRRPGKISERIKLIGQTKNFFQDLKPWMSTNRSPLDAVLIS